VNRKGQSPLHGIICLWSGLIVDIPDGWILCDGTNGTPDLRDRFIIAAGQFVNPGQSGGASSHKHTVGIDLKEHSHLAEAEPNIDNLAAGNEIQGIEPAGDTQTSTVGHTHEVQILSDSHNHDTHVSNANHYPVWYCLAFIMKL